MRDCGSYRQFCVAASCLSAVHHLLAFGRSIRPCDGLRLAIR